MAKSPAAPSTPRAYIASLKEPHRAEVIALDRLIRKHAPKLKPCVYNGHLGYGPFHYRYESGREGDAARLAIASRSGAISFYVLSADQNGWVAEQFKDQLPKAKIGRACIRLKRVSDLDEKALVKLIQKADKTPYGDAEQ